MLLTCCFALLGVCRLRDVLRSLDVFLLILKCFPVCKPRPRQQDRALIISLDLFRGFEHLT